MGILTEQGKVPIHLWDGPGVDIEQEAMVQIRNVASLPVVGPHVAIMPDAHFGIGATVGSVIPTKAAIIPSAVGVDLSCGMQATKTDLTVNDLEGKLPALRAALENQIPVGGPGVKGSWLHTPRPVEMVFERELEDAYERILAKHPQIGARGGHPAGPTRDARHRQPFHRSVPGLRGWRDLVHAPQRLPRRRQPDRQLLHRAREGGGPAARPEREGRPDPRLLDVGTPLFGDYVEALSWAGLYAARSRDLMMEAVTRTVRDVVGHPIHSELTTIRINHNYASLEHHLGQDLWITRKGAVSARLGEMGIIPGSMGAKSFIVRGLGNPESFTSCSHGAGRRMSRGAAKRAFTTWDVTQQTAGVECRKDDGIIDELPQAYKDLDAVMAAQADLVEIVATLKALVSVKG